jgi:thiamine transport system ATP-binding protein
MLSIDDVTVRFGDRLALDQLSMQLAPGEIISLLGPSGSGKTTLLRVIAGLQAPDSGSLSWDGEDVTGVPPHERGFGLMFQDLALFPHKDVAGNVEFGLRGDASAADRVSEVLELVGLEGQGDRSVGTLSGGEQQRVALARALAPRPRLLMLDEPLGSLDRVLRDRLATELREIFDRLGLPVIYVTHDQEEAFVLGHRVAVMEAGRLVQVDTPGAIWRKPRNRFVAGFLGFTNIADAEVLGDLVRTPWGTLAMDSDQGLGTRTIVVRPDALAPNGTGAIHGVVASVGFRGERYATTIDVPGAPPLLAMLHDEVTVGASISLDVEPDGVVVLEG